VKVDRRHDRRALNADEFALLVEAAMAGPEVVSIRGPDRAIMYILSAWTGYRRSEIGSLTKRSLRLDDDPPTITVAAAYSKRKRQDAQVLHRDVADRLREWLKDKHDVAADTLLFPVSAKIPGGIDRRTSDMMKADLNAARKKWIAAAETPKEKAQREQSDFLKYKDSLGLFADFHSNRHTFITNLEHAGVSPRRAQSLARHCDIRLTMGVYTHIGLHDQKTAIELLPSPPALRSLSKTPPSNEQAGGDMPETNLDNPQVLDSRQLDALWARLPEHVKAGLLAIAKAGPASDLAAGQGG
jgi:integrase/recombinase XerD